MVDATLLLPSIEEASLNAILLGRCLPDVNINCGNLEGEIFKIIKSSGDDVLNKMFPEYRQYGYSRRIDDVFSPLLHGGALCWEGVDLDRTIPASFTRLEEGTKKVLGEQRYMFLKQLGSQIPIKSKSK